jgi:hypothetical protein
MFYRCNHCGKYFNEVDLAEKNVDLESEYGVGGDFGNHQTSKWGACNNCGSTDIEELEDFEILDELNDAKLKIKELQTKIKEKKNDKNKN